MSVDPVAYFGDEVHQEPRVFTVAEARLRQQDSIEHLPVLGVDGYVVRGWSHLLAGWWRLGKTELMAAVILPWLRLGHRILWITEEPDSVWADRADMFDEIYEPVPWDNLTLVDAMSAPPSELLEVATSFEGDVVIVDTVREVCGIASMKDDDAVHEAMGPWLRCLRGRTSIYIAQHRKAAGENGERVMGSVTLPAKFDIVLELEGVDGHERRRRLTARRRRRATAPLVYEMDDDDRIVAIPDARSRTRVEVAAVVLSIIKATEDKLSTAEVASRMSPRPSRDTVLRALTAHAEAGRILRDPPIAQAAARLTVTWCRRAQLPQHLHTHMGEIGAADDLAADSASTYPLISVSTLAVDTGTCPECGSTCPILVGGDPNAPCGRHMPLSITRRSLRDWAAS